jgi:hypothetical protein
MGRHTKAFDEEPGGYGPSGHAPMPRPNLSGGTPDPSGGKGEAAKPKLPWLGRVPLLPALAGILAVGVVATAYGTSNISLNFTGGAPTQPQANPQCGGDPCPDQQSTDNTQAGRGSGGQSPVTVSFTTTQRTGGFRGTVTVANNGTTALKGWTLTFAIPNAQVLSLAGNVVVLKKGATTSVHSGHPLSPGSSAKVTFLARGTAADPNTCTLDKAPCSIAAPQQ